MSKSVRKVFATAVIAALAMSVAAPAQAQTTTAELQALIASLQVQINQLLAQINSLGGSTGGGVTGIPAGFTFSQNLAQGTSNLDVMYLQMLLNSDAATQLASSGAGSPGSETQFFGPITRSGVVKFQNKYAAEVLIPVGLTSGTGFFGPSTRAKANSMLAAAPTPTPGPGGTPTPTPTPGVIGTPGQEGSIVVTIGSTPASGAILDTLETEAVTAARVKATNSDVLVDRLDLEFDTRPWLYISELTVSDGTTSKSVAVTKGNSTEVTVGSKYSIRVSGLGILVPQDTTKTLTVTVTAVSGLPVGTTTKNIVLTFIANSIRGTDGAALTQTGPTASIATRTITVQEPSTADMEVTAHTDNPKARNVLVNTTAATTGIVLAVFNVKAKNNDVLLRTVEFKDSTASGTSGTLNVVYLYDGNTLLSSTGSITSTASSVLENVNLLIPQNTTKTLTLKADVKKLDTNYLEGASSTITIGAEATSMNGEDADSFATATVSGSNVVPGVAYFYSKAPKVTLASTSIVGVDGTSGSASPQEANAVIRINVEAMGGDIYVRAVFGTFGSSGLSATTSVPASLTVTETFGTNAASSTGSGGWLIKSGETKWFEYNVNMVATAGAGNTVGFFGHAKPVHIIWGTDDVDANWIGAMPQTWVVDEYRTSDIFFQRPI